MPISSQMDGSELHLSWSSSLSERVARPGTDPVNKTLSPVCIHFPPSRDSRSQAEALQNQSGTASGGRLTPFPTASASHQPKAPPSSPLPLHHTPESLQWEPIDLLMETLDPRGAPRSLSRYWFWFCCCWGPFLARRSFPAN